MADATIESATGDENDDNWLYGDSNVPEKQTDVSEKSQEPTEPAGEEGEGEEKDQEDNEENNDDEHFAEVGRDEQDQANGDADSQENGDSDSDDSDDVKVTIGDIKSGPQAYGSLNIKRGVGLVASGAGDKNRTGTSAGGKVTLEDLDGPGSINGVPALEFNIDTIEDKPWNKPGADISDYFNYGFNEVTWSAYCERQRRMRVNEAGVGLHVGPPPRAPIPDLRRPPGPMRNDDTMPPMMPNNYQTRENTIQVMTAERREYGRSGHGRDLAAPPDYFGPPPTEHYYPPPPQHHSSVPYEEPWGHPEASGWAPTEIKELTPGPMGALAMGPPPGLPPPPGALAAHGAPYTPPFRPHPPPHAERDRDRERDRERDRDRDRDRDRMRDREDRERRERDRRDDIPAYDERERDRERDRSRSIKPDRIREKSYRRERSRSRSRRHKSRSRSPRGRDRSRDRERSVKPKKDKDKDDDK